MYKLDIINGIDCCSFKVSVTRNQYENRNVFFAALGKRRSDITEGTVLDAEYCIDDKKKCYVSCEIKNDSGIVVVVCCLRTENDKNYKLIEIYKDKSWVQDLSVVPFPRRMIGFSLTNQCNLNCEMCWQVDRSKKLYASYEMISKTLEDIKMFGSPPVYFWGGEPFLHPDILRILKKTRELGLFSIINTNGMMLLTLADKLVECPPDMIIVSIDGTEKIHDKIRGLKGTYSRVINGIKKLNENKKFKLLIALNCVVTEDNYQILSEVEKLRNEISGSFLEFQLMMFYSEEQKKEYRNTMKNVFDNDGNSVNGFPLSMGNIDLDKLWKIIQEVTSGSGGRTKVFPYSIKSLDDLKNYVSQPDIVCGKKCANISSAMWVEADGNVYPCSNFNDYSVGNVYTSNAMDIWNNDCFLEFRDKLNNRLYSVCSRCCDMYKMDLFQAGD